MHAQDLSTPFGGNELAAPPREQSSAADAAGSWKRAPTRTVERPATDAASVVDDSGDIEYASWLRLLRARGA